MRHYQIHSVLLLLLYKRFYDKSFNYSINELTQKPYFKLVKIEHILRDLEILREKKFIKLDSKAQIPNENKNSLLLDDEIIFLPLGKEIENDINDLNTTVKITAYGIDKIIHDIHSDIETRKFIISLMDNELTETINDILKERPKKYLDTWYN